MGSLNSPDVKLPLLWENLVSRSYPQLSGASSAFASSPPGLKNFKTSPLY